jgi:surface carbohydrate biosynthesis protein
MRRRLCWRSPERCEVLQFTGTTINALLPLQPDFRIRNLPTVAEQINVGVLIRAMLRYRFGRWGYYQTFVEAVGARVVLVWHDTSLEAYQLQAHLSVPVWLIQNGVRHNVAPARGEGLVSLLQRLNATGRPSVARYLSFGDPAQVLLKPLVDAQFTKIGSFRLNEYAEHRGSSRGRNRSASRKIGFIVSFPNQSDVPGGQIWGSDTSFVQVDDQAISYSRYFKPDAIVLRLLNEVAKSLGHEVSVIGKRSSRDPIEREFFAKSSGCESINVIAHEKGSGYEVADAFDWLVTIDSTLGYEMLALNHKVGFISNRFRMLGIPTTEMSFGYPCHFAAEGPFWTSAVTEPEITSFLKRFLGIDETTWANLWREIVPNLMHLDRGNRVLRQLLLSEIQAER